MRSGFEPWFVVVGVFALAGACGGETVGHASIHDTPPTSSKDSGSDGGLPKADAGVVRMDGGTRLTVLPGPQIWDEEKHVLCTPRLATDGTERCLPYPLAQPVEFTDSSCQQAVIRDQNDVCGAPLKYYVDSGEAGSCSTHETTVYVAGSAIDTPKRTYPHNANPCSLFDRSASPSPGSYYEAVPSAPADWVEFTEVVEPVTEALGVASWKAPDGTRIPNGLRLLPSGEACEGFFSDATETHCIPTLRASPGDGFDNDQCTGQPVAGSCGPAGIIVSASPSQLYETGAVVSPVYFHSPTDVTQCTTLPASWTSPPNPSVFYEFGPPVSLDKYPALTLVKVGSDRLQIEYVTSGGKNLLVNSYFDTKYGMPCTPTMLSDGGTWCVPGAMAFIPETDNVFADSRCTRPIGDGSIQQSVPGPQTGLVFPFALVFPRGSSCNPKLLPTLSAIVEYSGPTYQLSGDQCVSADGTTTDVHWYAPGTSVDPSNVLVPVPTPP